jgi:hypothetical protein
MPNPFPSYRNKPEQRPSSNLSLKIAVTAVIWGGSLIQFHAMLLAFSPWCNVHHQLYHKKKHIKSVVLSAFDRFIMFYPQMSPIFFQTAFEDDSPGL